MYNRTVQKFDKSGFMRAVIAIAGGTAFSQGLMIIVLPLLTRLYSPSDFALLSVFVSTISIISVISCMRFDLAVPIAKSNKEAYVLLILAVLSVLLISVLIVISIIVFHSEIRESNTYGRFRDLIWLIPASVFFSGLYMAGRSWALRNKRYSDIGKTKIFQSFSGAGTQVAFGLAFGGGPFGLLLGQLLNGGAGAYRLLKLAASNMTSIKMPGLHRLVAVVKKNRKFPIYSVPEALASAIGIQIPILVMAGLGVFVELGFFQLAIKVMGAPMSLIGAAFSQVLLSVSPEKYRDGSLTHFVEKTITKLSIICVGPLLFIGINSEYIFTFIFGVNWSRSAEIATWMIPWVLIQFLSSPLVTSMHILGHQKKNMHLMISGIFIRIIPILIMDRFTKSWHVETYAISSSLFYASCFYVYTKTCGLSFSRSILAILKPYKIITGWILIATVVSMIVGDF